MPLPNALEGLDARLRRHNGKGSLGKVIPAKAGIQFMVNASASCSKAVARGTGLLFGKENPQTVSQFPRFLFGNEMTTVGNRAALGALGHSFERLDYEFSTPA